jgi:hypothetical protein
MAENKTRPTDASVADFLAAAQPERRRIDALRLDTIMCEVTGVDGVMWGPSIVGYGQMHYTYASGREGDWMRVGFSPRKSSLSLYGLKDTPAAVALLPKLGTHTAAVGCIYVTTLDALDEPTLRRLIAMGFDRSDYIAPSR